MQAFDAGIIQVNPTQDEEGKLGFSMTAVGVGGTAYFRITPELRDFLRLCHEKHGVVGFEYDFDEGGFNFGVILSNKKMEANPDDGQQ
jgi:hypothetical protein